MGDAAWLLPHLERELERIYERLQTAQENILLFTPLFIDFGRHPYAMPREKLHAHAVLFTRHESA